MIVSVEQGSKDKRSAAEFISETVRDSPQNVSILALGPLTNIALAMQLDSGVAQNVVHALGKDWLLIHISMRCILCAILVCWLDMI